MKEFRVRNRSRQGFTLVELLVVIVILGILISLVTAAVVRVIRQGKIARTRVEIGQLELSIGQFKNRFGFTPPSMLLLCERLIDYQAIIASPPNPFIFNLANDSLAIISKMFPNINWQSANAPLNGGALWAGIDWNGNSLQDGPVILEGDQCLVFFLGDIPAACDAGNALIPGNGAAVVNTPPAGLGFAADPKNPANPRSTDRIGPFFEFKSNRLVLLPLLSTNPPAYAVFIRSTLHYSYLDNYGDANGLGTVSPSSTPYMPYAYFSSYKARNAYNPYVPFTLPFPISDCPTLAAMNSAQVQGLWPYAEVPAVNSSVVLPLPRYNNPDSFQIISAGLDQIFGPGSQPQFDAKGNFLGFLPVWTLASGSTVYSQQQPPATANWAYGYDDQSNFSGAILGGSN